MLMSFATIYYLKLRIKDYSLFIMLGLIEEKCQLILMEGIGWIVLGRNYNWGAGTLYDTRNFEKDISYFGRSKRLALMYICIHLNWEEESY